MACGQQPWPWPFLCQQRTVNLRKSKRYPLNFLTPPFYYAQFSLKRAARNLTAKALKTFIIMSGKERNNSCEHQTFWRTTRRKRYC
jgi:hypothetical protein